MKNSHRDTHRTQHDSISSKWITKHALSWMYFCGYFALSNGPNWDVIWIIPIFGVIFGQNLGIWPPGVTIYRVTPNCFAINFEQIPSCSVLNVFLWLFCIIKWSKLGSYLHNTNIWGHFWSKCGYLTPRVTIYMVTPHCFAINFEEMSSCFVLFIVHTNWINEWDDRCLILLQMHQKP
jgi:hypothetical protein